MPDLKSQQQLFFTKKKLFCIMSLLMIGKGASPVQGSKVVGGKNNNIPSSNK
jgi:hypothetical protein